MDDERFCNHTVASFILGLGLSAKTPPGSLSGSLLITDSENSKISGTVTAEVTCLVRFSASRSTVDCIVVHASTSRLSSCGGVLRIHLGRILANILSYKKKGNQNLPGFKVNPTRFPSITFLNTQKRKENCWASRMVAAYIIFFSISFLIIHQNFCFLLFSQSH